MNTETRIVAPEGAPLHAALIGTEDVERALLFYETGVGLEVLERTQCHGQDFRRHWRLPDGVPLETIVLADRGTRVGRVVLFHFGGDRAPRIRTDAGQRFYGLVNLNFYTADIHRKTAELEALGFHPWTDPVQHAMQPEVGAPTEVMIEGPDGVIVNLVELTSGGPATRIGHMRAYLAEEYGYNQRGLTPVVTTQHCVWDLPAASRFYEKVTRMGVLIDDILFRDETNRFMGYPAGSRTRAVFMQGNHMFGKVALNSPLDQKFEITATHADPPATGYFAQSFIVHDLDAALAAARELGAEFFSDVVEVTLPGIGRTRSAVVRNPGSGALQEIVAA